MALRNILIAIASVLLGACGSVQQRASAPSLPPVKSEQRPADAAPPPVAAPGSRPGGYYKDDGPGDDPPPDLASLPDAQPRAEPLHRFANQPYTVLGQDYTPSTQLAKFRQRGLASWYGRMFHGKKTSIGEPYDMYAMTAAHPTLPIPSYARVTNVANGKSVVVRVNDRGPFHPGRVIDLSYSAASRLGYVAKGHTLVEVESIVPDRASIAATQQAPPARQAAVRAPARPSSPAAVVAPSDPSTSPAAAPAGDPIAVLALGNEEKPPASPTAGDSGNGSIFVQLGAFRTSDKAASFRDRVKREVGWLTTRLLIDASSGLYRIHLGPYGSLDDARVIAERVGEVLGLKPLLIRR
ncbi:MAG: septal ring lytic transglycosylase RlpA family protein [Sterolibacteriaceae bacterium]|uniref:Endolytic peptidoglycan transglycosylase RlpA n=1 Tax=Candidatus Methylophosphatis roskildensis TaxID=2899263 RepID=A0A9D7E270_9PROT|nr:septal ring lytic transglycosylase RlpA family protein [Candidatus Methylophosphatis roskildensis]MBK7235180.1 septal ring lytic transglycosylase RlpA family protein [Sterolibacteriaceae bacterium]MBK7662870.1 septal ring lytic transglycosylase RlpA family protein [Sterolibacteriaceae bacterium]MBK9086982.1 septal ring lytic transglycosylase RlpA family protein [Sterolibacteriaceae bacterium]